MQFTQPHAEDERDKIYLHVEYTDSAASIAGDTLMFGNNAAPGFADQTATAGIRQDLTGYRCLVSQYNAAIAFPVVAGVLEEDLPARRVATFTQAAPPTKVVGFGFAYANVVFPATGGSRESGTPIVPDYQRNGKLRIVDTGVQELNEPDFSTTAQWTAAGEFAVGSGVATYTFAATGAGTLTQATADLAQNAKGSTLYRFTYTAVNAGSFDGVCTITNAFAAAPVSLFNASGTYTTEFTSAVAPGDFVIDVTAASTGTWTIDNLRLSAIPIAQGGDAIQHLVCGHTLASWTGGNEELDDEDFTTGTPWDTTGEFAYGVGNVVYTFAATGEGTLAQTALNRVRNARNATYYAFTFTATNAGGFDGTCTITAGFPASAVTLPNTTGTHTVEFKSAADAVDQTFTIDVDGATTGTWTLDDFNLRRIEENIRCMVRCI